VCVVGDWQVDGAGIIGLAALGACVVTDAAFAIGATAIPDPVTDISDDIWAFINVVSIATAARAVQDPIHFDGRAMRKVEEGNRLVFIVSNTTDGNLGVSGYIRVLGKVAVRS